MSFILDALKKSDKKRQETSAPRLDTVHDSPPPQNRRLIRAGLMIAVLVLGFGVLFWLLSSEPQPPVAETSKPPSQAARTAIVPQPAVAETNKPPSQAANVPQPAVQVQPQPVKQPAPQILPQNSVPQASPEANRALSEQRVYAINELPTTTQRRIPVLHMSLHAHNKINPSAGLVRVNEQILRPGATLEGKFRLAEIRADGAVFSFDGYRFLLPRRTGSE